MREHQIAISLKPQQFELLQRLARERGFKSVTAYVKQKIVELALGLESDSPAAGSDGPMYAGSGSGLSAEQQTLLADLTRIHSELRAFVGHSFEDEIAAGVSAAAVDSATAFELPPPGQIITGRYDNEAVSGMTPYEIGAANSAGASYPTTPSASPNASSTGSSNSPSNFSGTTGAEPVSSQVLPSNNLGGFGFRLGGFTGAAAMPRFQAPVDNADRLSGYREIMDDLEELADRAFAISPRLGALDEEAPAEPATGRGARPGNESILVEPLLPGNANAARKGKADPHPQPISMVTPISAADLPGPAEIEAKASATGAASLKPSPAVSLPVSNLPVVQAVTGPAPQPHPPQTPAQLAPEKPVPEQQPAQIAPEEPSVPLAPEPQPELLAAEIVRPPLPGDDLLSELLDESLIAHAQAPKVAGNSTPAPDQSAQTSTEDSAASVVNSSESPRFVDASDSTEEKGQEAVEPPDKAPLPPDAGAGSAAAAYNDPDEERERQSQSGNVGSGPPPKRRRT